MKAPALSIGAVADRAQASLHLPSAAVHSSLPHCIELLDSELLLPSPRLPSRTWSAAPSTRRASLRSERLQSPRPAPPLLASSRTLPALTRPRQDLDIAIVKATNHDPVVPKQKHMVTIYSRVGKADSAKDAIRYVLASLSERVSGASEWLVVLKCLMVVHRTMREAEGDCFRTTLAESLFGGRGRDNSERRRSDGLSSTPPLTLFSLGGFKDARGGPEAWEMSGWVRAYALYLEEVCAVLAEAKIDAQAEPPGAPSASRGWPAPVLLASLPRLSSLLRRLLDCLPRSTARLHPVAAAAAADCLREVRLLFRCVSDGVINLVDKFFDMPPHEATAALDMYRRACRQVADLNSQLGALRQHEQLASEVSRLPLPFEPPPAEFTKVMEEYINSGGSGGGGSGRSVPSAGADASPPVYRVETHEHVTQAAGASAEMDFFGGSLAVAGPPQPAYAPPVYAAPAVSAQPSAMFDLLGSPGAPPAPAPAPAAPQPGFSLSDPFASPPPAATAPPPVPRRGSAGAPINLDSLYASASQPQEAHGFGGMGMGMGMGAGMGAGMGMGAAPANPFSVQPSAFGGNPMPPRAMPPAAGFAPPQSPFSQLSLGPSQPHAPQPPMSAFPDAMGFGASTQHPAAVDPFSGMGLGGAGFGMPAPSQAANPFGGFGAPPQRPGQSTNPFA